jgi:hypothetical protein
VIRLIIKFHSQNEMKIITTVTIVEIGTIITIIIAVTTVGIIK